MERKFVVPESLYPFQSHWHPYQDGCIHYLDEGSGPVVVCLHGNPTWSFLYRNIIKDLRSDFRVIVPDYPGFGFSVVPSGYGFSIAEHAAAIEDFLNALDLKKVILVVQDWGGPIGFSWAVRHPERVAAIALANTLLASPKGSLRLLAKVIGGFVGRWLILNKNYFVKKLMPSVIENSENKTEEIRKAYIQQFPTKESRFPIWMFTRQVLEASSYLDEIRSHMQVLQDKPAELLFGTKDPALGYERDITFWENLLPNHHTVRLPHANHYVQEDDPTAFVEAIKRAAQRAGIVF